MPTYEYKCAACKESFERFQQMSEAPLKKCPLCGKSKVKRLIGAGMGIIFKGSGFYETDYKRKEPSKKESSADSGAAKKDSSASGPKKTEK